MTFDVHDVTLSESDNYSTQRYILICKKILKLEWIVEILAKVCKGRLHWRQKMVENIQWAFRRFVQEFTCALRKKRKGSIGSRKFHLLNRKHNAKWIEGKFRLRMIWEVSLYYSWFFEYFSSNFFRNFSIPLGLFYPVMNDITLLDLSWENRVQKKRA